ncbi:MAG: hypothetical protein KF832_01375 [Caldilineaceae bacterium]|nr:hypothetical protein [Caldilineaceae bacterium]
MKITWQMARGLPVFIKGGALGMVDGAPVYAAGCTYPWRETEQAWWWDAARGDWFPVEPSLALGRAYTHGCTLEDGLLVLGGRKSQPTGRISLNDAWWLQRKKGSFSWSALPALNYPRAIPTIGVVGRKVLAVGGGEWERSQGGAFATRHLTHYELLDLDKLDIGWQDLGPLPFPSLVGSAFASLGDSLYVFGGYEGWTAANTRQLRHCASAWRYDFSAATWSQLADFPCAAAGGCAVPYGDQIILMGGALYFAAQDAQAITHTFHTLDHGTSRQRLIGAYSDQVFVYDIATNQYQRLAERMPIGLNDLRVTIAGDTIYAAGGETVDPALSNCSNAFMIGKIVA